MLGGVQCSRKKLEPNPCHVVVWDSTEQPANSQYIPGKRIAVSS